MWITRTNSCILIFIILPIALSPVIQGIMRSTCPIACRCYWETPKKFTVSCKSGYWAEIPSIPNNTSKLEVTKSNFGTLVKPKDCTGFEAVFHLNLVGNKIAKIAPDAFTCVPELLLLILSNNLLDTVQPGTFTALSKLQMLHLKRNKLGPQLFHEVAALGQLNDLSIAGNNMTLTAGSLSPLEHCRKLRQLDISGNTIHDTFEKIIKPVSNLIILTADNCGIESLDEDTFRGFKSLYQLSIKHNILRLVSNFTFHNSTSLRKLDVSRCFLGTKLGWLDYVPPLLFLSLHDNHLTDIPPLPKSITELKIGRNHLRAIRSNFFVGMQHLEWLSITESHIEKVHIQAFADCLKLTDLDLNFNNLLSTSSLNLSMSLANSSLRKLHLSNNNIRKIKSEMFLKLTPNHIQVLEMINCKIKVIEKHSFENFVHLEQLNLRSNQITELDKDVFQGLDNLQILSLSNNQLYRFSDITRELRNLTELRLGNNNIKDLGGTLTGRNLKILSLAKNKLTSLSSEQFSETTALEVLVVSGNSIEQLKHGTFSHLGNITKFSCSRNGLISHTLFSSGFSNMKNLKNLDLSFNAALCRSSGIIKSSLVTFTKLKSIMLSRCSLRYLLPNMFMSNTELELVSLADNGISYFEPTAFGNSTKLHTLFLQGNSIRFVKFESFVNLPALRELHLSNNPLMCTCEVLFILQAVRTNLLYMGSHSLESMRCGSPETVRGKTLKQLHMDLSDCENTWTKILIPVSGCCGSLVAAVLIFISWRYRWHMKYLWFIARAGRRRLYEMQDDTDYEYDAFIAYSEKDLWWVKEQLLPNLDEKHQGERGFRFCLHHRDWLVGADIVDNIVNSIERSRRTIIVLSDHFATSQWCQYELAMAQLRLDADGTSRELLVVVLLNEISAENLTPRLRFILTTKSYLPWSEDPGEQILFWKALQYSVSKVA